VTPTLSVDAGQLTVIVVVVAPALLTVSGVLGGRASPLPPPPPPPPPGHAVVESETPARGDSAPVSERDATSNRWLEAQASPVTVYDSVVVVPARAPST
jgi:hypothetical protein